MNYIKSFGLWLQSQIEKAEQTDKIIIWAQNQMRQSFRAGVEVGRKELKDSKQNY